MGQSTNAILFWGYTWVDEETRCPWNIGKDMPEPDEDEDEEDWESRYAATQGLLEPAGGFSDSRIEEWKPYWKEKDRLVAASNCRVDSHCSADYPMPYVAIRESHALALRGYPQELGDDHMKVMPEWREQIDNFCQVMGIPISQTEPRWYLVSDWN